MSYRLTAVLVVVLIVLGGLTYWLEMRAGNDGGAPVEPVQYLFAVGGGDVTGLKVSQGESTVVLEKDGDGAWWIAGDGRQEGDGERIEGVVARLLSSKVLRTIAEQASDLEPYGLDLPSLQAEVVLQGSPAARLSIGEMNPDGSAFYAIRENGGPVYLIEASIVGQLRSFVEEPPVPQPTASPAP